MSFVVLQALRSKYYLRTKRRNFSHKFPYLGRLISILRQFVALWYRLLAPTMLSHQLNRERLRGIQQEIAEMRLCAMCECTN
ncbi:hypothetical protein SAMN05216420_11334 [Nitrosospira sp. Nl5]|nr:hypothetical protein SAMN05216420_11334 [Nitrosospira sp. Nl5]